MNVLVLGGAGFIGSYVVDQLIEQGHSVWVEDNYSSCWMGEDLERPKFQNQFATYNKLENTAIESLVVLSMRYPLERDRILYRDAYEGYVHRSIELFNRYFFLGALKRVVIGSTIGSLDCNKKKEPVDLFCNALRSLLIYWHRPPSLGIYFVHMGEVVGDRRLPEAELGDSLIYSSVEYVADLISKLATSERHKKCCDIYVDANVSICQTLS